MSENIVLYELTTKGLAGIHTDVLEITSKGVNHTNRGLASSIVKGIHLFPMTRSHQLRSLSYCLVYNMILLYQQHQGKK